MRYEVMNRYYGHKLICSSKESMEHFIANAKKDPKDNLPVWEVVRELPDEAPAPKYSKDELLAMLAELEGKDDTKEEVKDEPVKRQAPAPKKKAKKLGDPGSSMRP